MAKKIEFQDFLITAKNIWGDRFSYQQPNNFDYKKGKIQIFCPVEGHGWFSRIPVNHITHNKHRRPSGCPSCFIEKDSKEKMKPFSQFLEDARKVHGKKYSYVRVSYSGAKKNMEITCPKHGSFFQTPDSHINGEAGCADCSNEETSKKNRELGLKNTKIKLSSIGGAKVKLVDETYVEQRKEANFVCRDHGEFTRTVILALNSVYPCKECAEGKANNLILGREEIREKIIAKEGNFKILDIIGEGKNAKVIVECCDCDRGQYTTSLDNVYQFEVLCGNCRRISSEPHRKAMQRQKHKDTLPKRSEEWLKRFYEKWGDRYDYSELNFKSAKEPIKVICNKPNHPPWYPTAHAHLTKGCKECANEELQGRYTFKYFQLFPEEQKIQGYLYYLQLEYLNQIFYKVGITKNNVKTRHSMLNSVKGLNWKILDWKKTNLFAAFKAEQEIQKNHGDTCRLNILLDDEDIRRIRLGPTECFSKELSVALRTKYFV